MSAYDTGAMKKKIMHVINDLSLGGTETALFRLLSTSPHSEYAFSLVVLSEPSIYSAKILKLGIPVHHLALKKANFMQGFWQLLLFIKQFKPDIIHTWLYHADLLGGCAAKLCGVNKIIWSIRCEGVGLKKTTQGVKILCALLSWIVPDFITSNSQAALEKHQRAGYNGKKLKLLYNGFDDGQFIANRLGLPVRSIGNNAFPPEALLFGTLARYHADKDYPTLIQAIDPICKIYPNAYFLFCGPGCHEENSELMAYISQLVHRNKVILLNNIEETCSYLNLLDIFILSSRTESFPNSLAEAMLCELPCIATDVGEVAEMLGDTGFLVASQDSKKLAAACLAMLSKPLSERQQLGKHARARIIRRYSLRNQHQQLAQLYGQ